MPKAETCIKFEGTEMPKPETIINFKGTDNNHQLRGNGDAPNDEAFIMLRDMTCSSLNINKFTISYFKMFPDYVHKKRLICQYLKHSSCRGHRDAQP